MSEPPKRQTGKKTKKFAYVRKKQYLCSVKSPYEIGPTEEARKAAEEVMEKVHRYMEVHPESELHRCGKMFGILIVESKKTASLKVERYLAAFSAKLDGSYEHEGFVGPVYAMKEEPVGTNKEESRRLQRLLFAEYNLLNGKGKRKNLLEIFQEEKPIIPIDEWFSSKLKIKNYELRMPPAGAGECCAPKLLQAAFLQGLEPVELVEFWVGAAPKNEIRQEGAFYAPCSGRCVPILRHMLEGVKIEHLKLEAGDFSKPEVVYEDEDLMVVNKPSGLLSVPGKTEELSLESYFKLEIGNWKFLKAVHRLDQDTSGLLVLAKNEATYKTLQAYFQRRDILKRYEAVCEGLQVTGDGLREGTISLPLLPNPYDRPRQMVDKEHGKPAITRYVIRERRDDGTVLVDFYPLTGRTHQLRVHAAHPEGLNAPIIGDRLYGQAAERLLLHAAEIEFLHPVTGEKMHFCIPSGF